MFNVFMLSVGQVVFSKQGRDRGLPFVVVATNNGFAWLVDGKLRHLEKPKKKKFRHLQPVKHVDTDIKERIEERRYLNDADFVKVLAPFHAKG